jgi:hypothetical protein
VDSLIETTDNYNEKFDLFFLILKKSWIIY